MEPTSTESKPHVLDGEHDPRVLRAVAKMFETENKRLANLIAQLQTDQAKAAQSKINLEESLQILRKRFFGKGSEKSAKDRERDRMNEDHQLLVHSENLVPPPKKKQTRNLEVEERVHDASSENLKSMSESMGFANPAAEQWEEIPGLYDESVEIEIVERWFKKVIHKRKKYRPKTEFAVAEKQVIIAAPGPVKLVPGSSYSIDFTVAVITDKYLNHIPLERQCRQMDSLGLHNMHTQVLYNLSRLASEHLVQVVEKIKKEILSGKLVHSDETSWPINNSKDSDGYMWIVSNNRGAYYRFEPTRSGKVIKETLGDYSGAVMTDSYSGYNQFRSSLTLKLALCHSHARRYFKDIEETNPLVKSYLEIYEELFAVEHQARTLAELGEIRDKKSQLIIDRMKEWLIEHLPEARSESHLKTAIEYSMKNWVELTKFLDDPNVPLTNNDAERTIRQAVMGRKNFYGSRSIDGADVAAVMYTVIETCKRVELDPRDYLATTIKKAAAGEPTETPFEMAKRLRQ